MKPLASVLRAVFVLGCGVVTILAALHLAPRSLPAADEGASGAAKSPPAAGKVYGEWRIRVKPDRGADYQKLIESKGLPLFRAAGGRMVGWWTTLIGDLYEQVTIWEYDGLSAFEKAIGFLGPNADFAAFVRERDPLLSGEESRFLAPAASAERPEGVDRSTWVIHEVHRVPLARQDEYLKFMQTMLPVLKQSGFRPLGPFRTAVGQWTEITTLFRFDSLKERDERITAFAASPAGKLYAETIGRLAEEVQTRLLTPAPFVK